MRSGQRGVHELSVVGAPQPEIVVRVDHRHVRAAGPADQFRHDGYDTFGGRYEQLGVLVFVCVDHVDHDESESSRCRRACGPVHGFAARRVLSGLFGDALPSTRCAEGFNKAGRAAVTGSAATPGLSGPAAAPLGLRRTAV